jgi:hypothetical protein
MPRQIHSSFYLWDPNLSTDMKGYYTSTKPDSFVIRKAMGSSPNHSGSQTTQVKNDYHLQ